MARTTIPSELIADNAVGITQLNVSDGSNGQFLKTDGSGTLSFATAGGGVDGISSSADATAITIDSSENVIMGKNSTSFSAEGFVYEKGAAVEITTDSNRVLRVNRTTNDGNLIEINKDGTVVGSIGSEGGDALFIQGGAASGSGLLMHPSNNFISPCRNGAKIDNAIDLGRVSHRFRDIFVGTQIHLGGNTSNGLDDYEEGTWTPTFGTLTTAVGIYQKIGNTVTVRYHIVTTGGLPSGGSQMQIGGLPFTSASNNVGAGPVYIRFYTLDDSSPTTIMQGSATVIRFLNINEQDFDFTLVGELEASHNNSIAIIGTMTYSV